VTKHPFLPLTQDQQHHCLVVLQSPKLRFLTNANNSANEWQDVQIAVIDEISFMSDTILKTLDRKLKEIRN
jgi:hypothetical protein